MLFSPNSSKLSINNSSIAVCFTRLKTLWEQLSNFVFIVLVGSALVVVWKNLMNTLTPNMWWICDEFSHRSTRIFYKNSSSDVVVVDGSHSIENAELWLTGDTVWGLLWKNFGVGVFWMRRMSAEAYYSIQCVPQVLYCTRPVSAIYSSFVFVQKSMLFLYWLEWGERVSYELGERSRMMLTISWYEHFMFV